MFSSELNQMVNHLKSQETKQQLRAFEEKNPTSPGGQAYFPRVSCLHLCTSEVQSYAHPYPSMRSLASVFPGVSGFL